MKPQRKLNQDLINFRNAEIIHFIGKKQCTLSAIATELHCPRSTLFKDVKDLEDIGCLKAKKWKGNTSPKYYKLGSNKLVINKFLELFKIFEK